MNSNIRGFQGGSAFDVIGVGCAVEEADPEDETYVDGLGLLKDSPACLQRGAVDGIAVWDLKDAGYVMNVLADKVLNGREGTDGMNRGVPGYESISVIQGP